MTLYREDAPTEARECSDCDGAGRTTLLWGDGDIRQIDECDKCEGSGRVLCATRKRLGCEDFAVDFEDETRPLCAACSKKEETAYELTASDNESTVRRPETTDANSALKQVIGQGQEARRSTAPTPPAHSHGGRDE